MATRRAPRTKDDGGDSAMRDTLKFRLAAKYVKGKRLAQKKQFSKKRRSLQDDD